MNDDLREKSTLANIAYYNNPARRKYGKAKGLKYLEDLSDHNTAVFFKKKDDEKDGKIKVAYRGSITGSDWYNNAFKMTDGLSFTTDTPFSQDPDFIKDKTTLDQIKKDYPNAEIEHIGHSRGGARARAGYYHSGGKAITYNSAFTPNERKTYNKAKKEDIRNVRSDKDVVSAYLPKEDTIQLPTKEKPILSSGAKYLAGLGVGATAGFFGVDSKTATGAFNTGVSVGNAVKQRADAHSMVQFLPEEEMGRLAKEESGRHYDQRDLDGQSFPEAFPRLRGTARKFAKEELKRRATLDLTTPPQGRLRGSRPLPAEAIQEPTVEEPEDLPEDPRIQKVRDIAKIQNVREKMKEESIPKKPLSKPRERRVMDKIQKEIAKQREDEPLDEGEGERLLDNLTKPSEAEQLKVDDDLQYQELTSGGFLYLHSGTGNTDGRFVNFANNPYGQDDHIQQCWSTDWWTGNDYPTTFSRTVQQTWLGSGPMRKVMVGGPNGQFFSAPGAPLDLQPGSGGINCEGQDTKDMTYTWDRPFIAPQGFNLTLTCTRARVDNTIYNIWNSMANDAVPKYWGYCEPRINLKLPPYNTDPDIPNVDESVKVKPNAWFYSGYNILMTPRFLPPMATLPTYHRDNPIPYRGRGGLDGLRNIQGNDILMFTIQYGYRGTEMNRRAYTTAIKVRPGKYTPQALADEINYQCSTVRVYFTNIASASDVIPIPPERQTDLLSAYVSVEWLPSMMKFKFINKSEPITIADTDVMVAPDYLTSTPFYVFMLLKPTGITWSQLQQGDPAYPDRLLWANPMPDGMEIQEGAGRRFVAHPVLQMFDKRIMTTPLGIPNLRVSVYTHGKFQKGNINPYTGTRMVDVQPVPPTAQPNPPLPEFDTTRMGNCPIFSENYSYSDTNGRPASAWGQAGAGGMGFIVMFPRTQETKWFGNTGTTGPNYWYPFLNLAGTPPSENQENDVSHNPFQPITTPASPQPPPPRLKKNLPTCDVGQFISPCVPNMYRTRNIFIELDYDTNSQSSSTRFEPNNAPNFRGVRPALFKSKSNSSIIASIPVSNPMYDHTSECLYEPENPFLAKTIRIPNNSFRSLRIKLKGDDTLSPVELNGGTYDLVFKVGLIPVATAKFDLPSLTEYNLFIREFYKKKNRKMLNGKTIGNASKA